MRAFFVCLLFTTLFGGVYLGEVQITNFETSDSWSVPTNNQPFQRVLYSSVGVPPQDGNWAVEGKGVNNELRLPQISYYGGVIRVSLFAYTLQPTSLTIQFFTSSLLLVQKNQISINNNGWNMYLAPLNAFQFQVSTAFYVSVLYSGNNSIYLDSITVSIDGRIINCPTISSTSRCLFVTAVSGSSGWSFSNTALNWVLTPAFTYLKRDFIYLGGLLTGSINFRGVIPANRVTIQIAVNQTSYTQDLTSGFTNFDLTSSTQYTVGQTYTILLTFTTNVAALVTSISLNVAGNCSECHQVLTCEQFVNGVTCSCDRSSCPGDNTQCIVSTIDRSMNPCSCLPGYTKDNSGNCVDINECTLQTTNNCTRQSLCNNFGGGYNCTCRSGYETSNGGVESLINPCRDINECTLQTTNICTSNATCNNFDGGYSCTCRSGYKTNNGVVESLINPCLDINECTLQTTNICTSNATCNNFVGGYSCTCRSGYKTSNGIVESLINPCLDINECTLQTTNICTSNATCNNFVGGYSCTCRSGYKTSNGNVESLINPCLDFNECSLKPCSWSNGVCINKNGSYSCSCAYGWKLGKDDASCVSDNSGVVQVCEGNSYTIVCPGQDLIKVVRANYGRTSSSVCPGAKSSNTNCNSRNSLQVVQNICSNKRSCILYASNRQFGDPCVGTFKYLEVQYYCKPQTIQPTFIAQLCYGGVLTINCKNRKLIIVSANYKKNIGRYCFNFHYNKRDCRKRDFQQDHESFLEIVRKRCLNQQSCTLKASSVFGDSCDESYLEVKYYCQ